MVEQTIGDRLRQARERAGMTQEALADKLAVSHKTISAWERGRSGVGVAQLRQAAAVLGVDLLWLIGEDGVVEAKARRTSSRSTSTSTESRSLPVDSVQDLVEAFRDFSRATRLREENEHLALMTIREAHTMIQRLTEQLTSAHVPGRQDAGAAEA